MQLLTNSSCRRCYFSKHTNVAALLSAQCLPDPPAHAGTLRCRWVPEVCRLKEAEPRKPIDPEGTCAQNPQLSPSHSRVFKSCLCCQQLVGPLPTHRSEHFYQRPGVLLCLVTGKQTGMDRKNPACCLKH